MAAWTSSALAVVGAEWANPPAEGAAGYGLYLYYKNMYSLALGSSSIIPN